MRSTGHRFVACSGAGLPFVVTDQALIRRRAMESSAPGTSLKYAQVPRWVRVKNPASVRILRWCDTVDCPRPVGSARSHAQASSSSDAATIEISRSRVGSARALSDRARSTACSAASVSRVSGAQQAVTSMTGRRVEVDTEQWYQHIDSHRYRKLDWLHRSSSIYQEKP